MVDKSTSYIKETLVNSSGYLFARIIPAFAGFIALPIFTKILGPHKYGQYAILLSIVSFFSVFTSGWVKQSIIRYYYKSDNKNKYTQFISTILSGFLLVLILIISIIIVLYVYFSQYSSTLINNRVPVIFALFAFIGISIFEVLLPFYRAKEYIAKFTLYNILFYAGKVGIAGLLLTYYPNIEVIFIGTIMCLVVLIPIMIRELSLIPNFSLSKIDIDKLSKYWKFGYPFAIVLASNWCLSFFSRYLLEYYRSSTDVGIYSAVFNLSNQSINVLFMALMMSVYPMMVKVWEREGEEFSSLILTKMIRIFWMISFPALIGLIVLSGPILRLLTTSDFNEGIKIIPILSSSSFLIGLNHYLSKPYELKEKTFYIARFLVVISIVNIIVSFILIPKTGIVGAAYAYLISFLIYTGLNLLFGKKILKYKIPVWDLIKLSLLALVMGGIILFVEHFCFLAEWWVIPLSFFGVLIYAGLLFITNCITTDEKRFIQKAISKIVNK